MNVAFVIWGKKEVNLLDLMGIKMVLQFGKGWIGRWLQWNGWKCS